MSLQEFQKEKCPNILQSFLRRELGLLGMWGPGGKESTSGIDVIINRQLIASRASRTPAKVISTRKKRSSQPEEEHNLKSKLFVQTLEKPEDFQIIFAIDKVFIRAKRGVGRSYTASIIGPALGLRPILKPVYEIPSNDGWSGYDTWMPSEEPFPRQANGQHILMFAVEKPGHHFRSFYFDSGINYKSFLLDSVVKFRSISANEKTLILNPIKASLGEEGKDSATDFIVLTCPELKLVTRCRVTKAAIGRGSIQVLGEFILLTYGRRIEVCDLMQTIESSDHVFDQIELNDGSAIDIPVTNVLMEKPQILYVVQDIHKNHLEFGYPSWPPHYIKKAKENKFILHSTQAEFNRYIEGEDLLNLADPTVTHDEDNLTFHPDCSSRLILAGQYEIRVILMKFNAETEKTAFETQFSLNLAELNAPPPVESSVSRRNGLRNVPRPNYLAGLPDQERGILKWGYYGCLDIFVILEFSSQNFKLHLYDNQSWEVLSVIDLSDSKGLAATCSPATRYMEINFSPNHFIVDITHEFIAIRRIGTATNVSNLCIVNLLSDDSYKNGNGTDLLMP